MNLTVDALPPEKLERAIARLEREKARRAAENWLAAYQPYPKQAEFHAAGATHRERLLMASNQTGKTLAAAMELTMHATGIRRGGSAGDSILRSAPGLAVKPPRSCARPCSSCCLASRASTAPDAFRRRP